MMQLNVLDSHVRDTLTCIMDALKLTRLTKLEMEILDKYVQVMNPIAQALDKLQGEGDCFLVNLIPTIHQTYKHLLHVSGCVNHTKQLAVGLSDAVKSRFAYLFTYNQCRINHVADVANATGLRPQGGLRKSRKFFSARQ